jgi:hypothetical protein
LRRARDAVATVHRLIELLDNQDIEAALMRVDRRNSFELVTIRIGRVSGVTIR